MLETEIIEKKCLWAMFDFHYDLDSFRKKNNKLWRLVWTR